MNDFSMITGSGKKSRHNFGGKDTFPQSLTEKDTGQNSAVASKSDSLDILFDMVAKSLTSLLSYSNFSDAIKKTLEFLGTTTNMDRVYIFENHIDPDKGILLTSQRFEWASDQASVQIDNPYLQNIPYETVSPRLAGLLQADMVCKEVSRNFTPSEQQYLAPQGIKSIIIVPIRIDGRLWGFVGFDDCHQERDWTQNEESILRVAAAGIGNAIKRKQAEEALKYSEALYRIFFETTQSVVLLLSPDARILAWNSAAEKLFGCNIEEVIGKSYVELFVQKRDQTEVRNSILQILAGKESRNVEGEIVAKNGAIRTIRWNAVRLPERNTIPSGIIACGQDISERKRIESDLARAQKLETVGILAGGIAHDFNNLLATVLGNISLAKVELNPDDEIFIKLTCAEQACFQARELTNRLISFSDSGAPLRKTMSLAAFLQKVVPFSLTNAAIHCEYALPENLHHVTIDEDQIQHVIGHLLRNAQEAMPDGGQIVIEAENVDVAGDLLPGLESGPYVRCAIRDQGKGIPREIQPHIFDPHFTSKSQGTQKGSGLGLAVCFSIIKKHDGTITFSSEPGRGTTFEIYLPAVMKKEDAAPVESSAKPVAERILLMDDEETVREITGQILTHLGYEVELASNGDEAIARFMKAESEGRPFSQVLLDLTIRGGMGGFKTLQKLREINPEVRAVIVSGYTNDPVVEFFNMHGFNASLTKPFTIKQLKTALANSKA
ncbi:MAG: Blue-light-activated protein [Syntrophus sp. PtaB.Bin001]|nr:MAG: Blue-light-activated protein [Syntrophus sp. PtaB.Bin001]